jgi:hypothetical protein
LAFYLVLCVIFIAIPKMSFCLLRSVIVTYKIGLTNQIDSNSMGSCKSGLSKEASLIMPSMLNRLNYTVTSRNE